MPKIWVIILVWNNLEDTLHCLESIKKTTYSSFEILVVDNGSKEGIAAQIKEAFPSISLLENGDNLGFAEGNNRGIRFALQKGAEAILLLNNDTLVDPGILDAFANAYSKENILGAKVYRFGSQKQFDHLGGIWNGEKKQFDLVGLDQHEDAISYPPQLDYITGCCLFAPAEAFQKIGLLDPRFFLYWEESDWCARAKRAGFKMHLCPEAKIWHKGAASFSGRPHTTYFWWRNRLLWMEKNRPPRERIALLPEILHLYKLRALLLFRSLLYALLRRPKHNLKQKALGYKAACRGVEHYLVRRFGNAPKIFINS